MKLLVQIYNNSISGSLWSLNDAFRMKDVIIANLQNTDDIYTYIYKYYSTKDIYKLY